MASIAFEHVTKRYADGAEAVKDMNLEVADGEFMILVGPSGSGKSTALRMVGGLEDITEGVSAGFIGSRSMNFLPGQLDGDRVRTPIGDLPIPHELRRRLERGDGGGRRGVTVGIRPEHFEDANLVTLPASGHTFKTKIDVLEALGSESYAHFTVDSPRVSSSELEELADETSTASPVEGVQVVARLAAATGVKQGQEAQLWVDTSQLHLFDNETGRSLLTRRLAVAGPSTASPPLADRVA